MELSMRPVRRQNKDDEHSNSNSDSEFAPRRQTPDRPHIADGDDAPTPLLRGGWSAAKQQADAVSEYAQSFRPEAQAQIIKFLEDAPYVNYRRHWIERNGPNGIVNRPYVCPQSVGSNCPICEMGDKPQPISAFNIAVISDDGRPVLKSWEVGIKLFSVLSNYHNDPKIGPLTRGYFAVSKTAAQAGSRRGGTTQTNVNPVKPSSLTEDWGVQPPNERELASIGVYTADIIKLPKKGELQEIAEEMANDY